MGALFLATIGGIALVLWLLIFARLMVSWFDPMGRSPVAAFLLQVTEPILAPVRNLLPRTGMLDLSGFVVLIILGFIMKTAL
ncbi:MAG: YggT family protein [Candidatus Limnocylindrales bacterium]